MTDRFTINQRVQIGAETTAGTNVAASKLLECSDWVMGINGDIIPYTPTGHKYANVQEENTEWVDITMGGNFDYNGCLYPLSSVMGITSPTAHGSSSVAKDWVFTPPTFGAATPQTYTIEQGDSVRAQKVNYGIFTKYGYTGTRKNFTNSGTLMAQPILDAITLTGSPTAVPIAPVVGKQINVYLDPTSAGLGTTLLTRALAFDYSMDSVYNVLWVLNRGTVGFTTHVDTMPKTAIKLKVAADAVGMGLLTSLQQNTTQYLRYSAQGNVIDNNQTVTISGGPSGGTFTLTYKGQTTSGIAYNAVSSAVQSAFTGLSTVGAGNATVAGSAGGPYTISFASALATDLTVVTTSGASLTGGTSPTSTVTQTQAYNSITHDMAIKVGKPSTFADEQGLYAIEWTGTVIEDPTWGKSQTCTVTNLITAL